MVFFRRSKKKQGSIAEVDEVITDAAAVASDGPLSFGYKCAWLAIRCTDARAVAVELGLSDVREVAWREGFGTVDNSQAAVFVMPPIDGWCLALLGGGLWEDLAASVDLARLSVVFGEVQGFGSHRVVDYCEWQRWVAGHSTRRYCWVGDRGEIPFCEGEPAAAEGTLATPADLDGDWGALEFADEETVIDVAREWSVDPTTLDSRDLPVTGLLGRAESASQSVRA